MTEGRRSEKKTPTGKICSYRVYDKVKYKGKIYFIRGRMSSGYANVINIFGKDVKIRPMPKFKSMEKVGSRKTCIKQMKRVISKRVIHLVI